MEEKLNELLEKAELKVCVYEKIIDELKNKVLFLNEAGFKKEAEWVQIKKIGMVDVYNDYQNTVEQIRKLLNDWLS